MTYQEFLQKNKESKGELKRIEKVSLRDKIVWIDSKGWDMSLISSYVCANKMKLTNPSMFRGWTGFFKN